MLLESVSHRTSSFGAHPATPFLESLASVHLERGRIEEAKRRYNLLLAQNKSAQTREKIQQSLSAHADSESPMALVARLEEKIQNIEARTEANGALEQIESEQLDLESKFLELEKAKRGDDAPPWRQRHASDPAGDVRGELSALAAHHEIEPLPALHEPRGQPQHHPRGSVAAERTHRRARSGARSVCPATRRPAR